MAHRALPCLVSLLMACGGASGARVGDQGAPDVTFPDSSADAWDVTPADDGQRPEDTADGTAELPDEASEPVEANDGAEPAPDLADEADAPPESAEKVVISELMLIPLAERGQYVEITNVGDHDVDLDGWSLDLGTGAFHLSGVPGEVVLAPGKLVVAGQTALSDQNGFAHVVVEWPVSFSLPPPQGTLVLRDKSGAEADRATWSWADGLIPVGRSLERTDLTGPGAIDHWRAAPSLITFLDETGLYAGARGSPGRPNPVIVDGPAVVPNSDGQQVHVASPAELHRFEVAVTAGDLVAFEADVDRVSGDLDTFLGMLRSDEFVTDVTYDDQIGYDFLVYWRPDKSGPVTLQVQADFFSLFEAADVTARACVADALAIDVPADGLIMVAGDKRPVTARAAFTRCPDAARWDLADADVEWASTDDGVARVEGGALVAVGGGKAVVSATFHGGSGDLAGTFPVVVGQPTPNETCDLATDVSAGGTFQGTTIGAGDDYSAHGCIFASITGPDLVYSFRSEVAATFRFTVTPAGQFDPILYVLDACPPVGDCLDGTMLFGPGQPDTLDFDAAAGTTYYLVVDGALGDSGVFSLEVSPGWTGGGAS